VRGWHPAAGVRGTLDAALAAPPRQNSDIAGSKRRDAKHLLEAYGTTVLRQRAGVLAGSGQC